MTREIVAVGLDTSATYAAAVPADLERFPLGGRRGLLHWVGYPVVIVPSSGWSR
jgi:hypothetical protein